MFSSAVHIFSSLVFLSVSLRSVRQAEKDIRDHVALLHSLLDQHHRRQQEVLRQRYKDLLHQSLVKQTEVRRSQFERCVCGGRGGRKGGGEGSERICFNHSLVLITKRKVGHSIPCRQSGGGHTSVSIKSGSSGNTLTLGSSLARKN